MGPAWQREGSMCASRVGLERVGPRGLAGPSGMRGELGPQKRKRRVGPRGGRGRSGPRKGLGRGFELGLGCSGLVFKFGVFGPGCKGLGWAHMFELGLS